MSQGRRPAAGAMSGGYPQQSGQYMGQMPPMGPGPGPQRFMMGGGQMGNQMYPSQPQMYMPQNQQQPGPSVSPSPRSLTPQQSQIQQMQNLVSNSPKQPSPAPSVSSDHGSTNSLKQEDMQDMKLEPDDPSGENSRGSTGGSRPVPSPVGSTGSRSNTPGGQAGSPMPVRPSSGHVDGSNKMTQQSPMATQQGYNQQMMPPPNSMSYMPGSGKMGSQMPGHYPQYNSQYPQGSYPRQQTGMGNMSGPGGPMQNYPGAQPSMYQNGPGQMPGGPMYGNMPGMNRNMSQSGYGSAPFGQSPGGAMGGMGNSQYPGYNSHMGPMAGQHGLPPQQQSQSSMAPGSTPGPLPHSMSNQPPGSIPHQHSGHSSNKAAQAAQAAMMAAANSTGPRISHSRGTMSPSRGMFGPNGGSGGGPLAQMNNMTNSPNFGSPSLNSMSNAVEQLGRASMPTSSSPSPGLGGSVVQSSTPSPVPKPSHSPAAMPNSNSMSSSITHGSGDHCQSSPLSNTDTQESGSRPSSAAHPPDLTHATDTTSSDSSTGMPSDSTSVDSGFHSSDQGDKTSDTMSTPTQSVPSPTPSTNPNGEVSSRTIENISPPNHHPSHQPQTFPSHPNHQQMGSDINKMPYSNDNGIPIPPSMSSNAMSSMPSSGNIVSTSVTGPLSTTVTQSIASPVTTVSTAIPQSHPAQSHPHQQHIGPHGGPPHPMISHSMGPGGHPGMMPNGMPAANIMNAGHMGGPGQMPPNMMPNNMGGPNMNINQNGPMMAPVMGHNGPMMQGPPNSGNMHPMGHMPPHHAQHQPHMNNMPILNNTGQDDHPPPEKKKKTKKSSSDLSKLYELGPEPDRRQFIERLLAFLEDIGQPVTTLPVISKTTLDLYKLYFCVREKGGLEEVTRNKKWREVCTVVGIGTSASAAHTLKKNYIRYLFRYECKFDRGGINPEPILAALEAQAPPKREPKAKNRAPSPGSNSNDSFRPPSAPNNQMDPSFPPNMPPPYMQNHDGNMANPHMSGGNMMMPQNNMMGGQGHHGSMIGPPGMGQPSMMGGPSQGMMAGQQSMVPNSSNTAAMLGGPQMMQGGPPSYGGPMMPQHPGASQSPQASPANGHYSVNSSSSAAPGTSDSVSVQDPFSDDTGYQRGTGPQTTPPPSSSQMSSSPAPNSSGHPGMQQSSMGTSTMTSTANRPLPSGPGYGGGDAPMTDGFQNNLSVRQGEPSNSGNGGQYHPYGQQQFDRTDRFNQPSPNMGIRPPGPTPGMVPSQQPHQQPGENGAPMFPGARFPGHQGPMMRPPQAGDGPNQFQQTPYQGQNPYTSGPGPQYHGYQQTPGAFPGPRPPFGTPSKRFPDEHGSDMTGSQWSPHPRQRMQQNASGYMPPVPPSTPPMGPFGGRHRNSPQARERLGSNQKIQKPTYGSIAPPPQTKKELIFPPTCVEGVNISATKRKRLTNKDLAPFEAWRLMLALKSGLLAESTWALDTLNIMLFDDSTYGYFGLGTLPGLLEVLTEHFRQCLIQMFDGFQDLEKGQPCRQRHQSSRLRNKADHSMDTRDEEGSKLVENSTSSCKDEEPTKMYHLTGTNYTNVSRKGLPVKFDDCPTDSTVLESKYWDIYTHFDTKPDHWLTGCGDITDHILTHLESDNTNTFLSRKFRKKRKLDSTIVDKEVSYEQSCKQVCTTEFADGYDKNSINLDLTRYTKNSKVEKSELEASIDIGSNIINPSMKLDTDTKLVSNKNFNQETNHSNVCNGVASKKIDGSPMHGLPLVKTEPGDGSDFVNSSEIETEPSSKKIVMNCDNRDLTENKDITETVKIINSKSENLKEPVLSSMKKGSDNMINCEFDSKPLQNGDIEEPHLLPMINTEEKNGSVICKKLASKSEVKDVNDCSDSSPPVLIKAECLNEDSETMSEEKICQSMNTSCANISMDPNQSAVVDTCKTNLDANKKDMIDECSLKKADTKILSDVKEEKNENSMCCEESVVSSGTLIVGGACLISETEEMSANIVNETLKENDNKEDEAFQRDDPPLTVTSESLDELGRRCVSISNIFRSLSYVPGNEIRICQHPGILRLLGRLLLLHHSHPVKPPPRKLPSGDEEDEELEEPPRVYDNEHWWWDYLDQLRENTLVVLSNICGHLLLINSTEEICFPLLEGLLHWVVCPASVARDPMPTLPPGSTLSPQRLVLEALCKLCIHPTNVDLLLATPSFKRLLELFNVLVHLLSDRNQPVQREFSIVLLSFLVSGDSSAARAIALQHPSVSLLVDFLETAEQNALTIANQQGLEVLQSNPEVMGTSLDMLRRAALILLHMSKVPDNRKLFVAQQPRLLNLVMSQILDQTVSNTLSEVLFECSQFS